jgi:alpha-L-fucosidase
MKKLISIIGLALLSAAALGQPRPYPERLHWWADARFGMFIHWGPISLKAAEISWSRANTNPRCPNNGPIPAEEYDNLYKRFDPAKFDAREWVRIAKAAGMKYMVLTAKHGDGFLLWDSKVSDYNIMHTPFHRDVCGELARAAHEAGMRIGWYFSPMDWKDPDCRGARNAEFVARMQAEIRELLSNYGRIDLMWFDCDGREALWDQEATYALVKRLQPDIVINNRLDAGPNTNVAQPGSIGPHADYFTPEQWIGGYEDQHPWESCMTVSRRGQWSWGGSDDGVKSRDDCLNMLVRCVGGDGNVLLDVGPMPTGQIAPEQAGLLRQIGAWLASAGASIRGSRGGPWKPGEYGACTRKGRTVFLHVQDWGRGSLRLPPLPARVIRARVVGGGRAAVRDAGSYWEVTVPEAMRHGPDTIVALELDRAADGIPSVAVPSPVSLCTGARATASNVFGNMPEYGADKAVDGRDDTRWATDGGIHAAWLEVDLGAPKTFDRVVILQAFPELRRVRRFAVEYWQDGAWHACWSGKELGAKLSATFPAVTAQRVRLNITEATEGPTIWEFRLFSPAP